MGMKINDLTPMTVCRLPRLLAKRDPESRKAKTGKSRPRRTRLLDERNRIEPRKRRSGRGGKQRSRMYVCYQCSRCQYWFALINSSKTTSPSWSKRIRVR